MKALGFEPEHERPDRDQFLRVHLPNVKQGLGTLKSTQIIQCIVLRGDESSFLKSSDSSSVELLTPYDLSSVLHLHPLSSSSNGEPTLGAVDPLFAESVGPGLRSGQSEFKLLSTIYYSSIRSELPNHPVLST